MRVLGTRTSRLSLPIGALVPHSLLSKALAVALLLVPAVRSNAQMQTLLVGADQRAATSLNGPWHYLVDQPPAGALYDSHGNVRDDTYAQNTHPNITSGPHNGEYDFATAPTLNVPGDWNTQDPTLFRFEGVVWYQRDFDLSPRSGMRYFLHIGAANYRSVVWVNGKRVCQHEGGFTPFDCEITAAANSGANFVVIAVDSTRHKDDIPSLNYDWFNYGGLTRDVSILTLPASFIDDYDVHLQDGASFDRHALKLEGYVHVEGAALGSPVTLRIPELHIDQQLTTDAQSRASFSIPVSTLKLWSPDQPSLYRVELTAGRDHLTDSIGFRDVRVAGTRILLNGQPIFLRGVNAHAEAPIRTGRACSDGDVDHIFSMLHAIHANFVRLAHYPQDERMERRADRDGIVVWSEIPLWQGISFDKPEVYAKAQAMLGEMIRRDRNKASVLFWSVSNETPNNPTRTDFLTKLANEARRMDGTRLITSALIGPAVHGSTIVQDDPLAQALDVIGQNEYVGWYVGRPEDADHLAWQFPQKPVIMSEFGAEAKFGNHGTITQRWAEEQQVNVLEHQFVMFRHIPQLAGVSPWVLMDFRSPSRNLPVLQDGYNRKGLFSEKMQPKQSVETIRHLYTQPETINANAAH